MVCDRRGQRGACWGHAGRSPAAVWREAVRSGRPAGSHPPLHRAAALVLASACPGLGFLSRGPFPRAGCSSGGSPRSAARGWLPRRWLARRQHAEQRWQRGGWQRKGGRQAESILALKLSTQGAYAWGHPTCPARVAYLVSGWQTPIP